MLDWDVSKVTNMKELFKEYVWDGFAGNLCESFNGNLKIGRYTL